MSAVCHSAVYEGWLRHRRSAPCAHQFRYRLYMMYLDLAELDAVFARRWFWSASHWNLACFRRADFHGDPSVPLDRAVRDTVERRVGRRTEGPIRLLAHLRYFGHCFNPVTFYYGYDHSGEHLEWILAEVTNTPWQERHAYVLAVDSAEHRGSALSWQFDKAFHVSPFLPMDCRYHWHFRTPGELIHVHMQVTAQHHAVDATLVLERRAISTATLARVLFRHPLMTLKVMAGIHWQALRLWLKRSPFHDHPDKVKGRPQS